jgi:transposase
VKNDKVDARTLAHLLRTGLLPEAWIAPPEVREARRLVRMRAGLVRIRTRLKCPVHAVLAKHGIRSPMADLFGPGGQRLLSTLKLPTISQGWLQACLRIIEELGEAVEVADQAIEQLCKRDERVRRLLPIPGSGVITAVTIVAEVGELQRFQSPRHLCSWAGLLPRRTRALATPDENTSPNRARAGSWSRLPPLLSRTSACVSGTYRSRIVAATRSPPSRSPGAG